MGNSETPAGWYPDPRDPSQVRYWDGASWGDQTAAATAAATGPAEKRPQPMLIAAAVAVVFCAVAAGAYFLGSNSDDGTTEVVSDNSAIQVFDSDSPDEDDASTADDQEPDQLDEDDADSTEPDDHQELEDDHEPDVTVPTVTVWRSDSTDPIVIPIHSWTSQIVGAEVVGQILTMGGANVEFISSDSGAPVYEAMCFGDVHLVHEVWESSFASYFDTQVGKGCVVEAATHSVLTREDWWYPTYLEEDCPGLPDWTALLEPDCAAALAAPETAPNGRFISGSVEWVKHYGERIEALNLPLEVVYAGSSDAIWAELDAAYAKQEPIMVFNWSPNFVEAVYDGKFVEFPDYAPECESDPSWGLNPNALWDCGSPKNDYIKIGAWSGFEAKWPHAFCVLQNINFTNLDLATMSAQGVVDGMSVEDNAFWWLTDNDDRVQDWLGTCA